MTIKQTPYGPPPAAFVPSWPVAPTSTAAIPGKEVLRRPSVPATSYQQPVVRRRPLWGSLHSTVMRQSVALASAAQLPLGFIWLLFLAFNAWPPVLIFTPLVAMIVLQQFSRVEFSVTDWGVMQRSQQRWEVPWGEIERIEILPSGQSLVWGQREPTVVVHDRGRGRVYWPHQRTYSDRLISEIRYDQVGAFVAMAEAKGVWIDVPLPLYGTPAPSPRAAFPPPATGQRPALPAAGAGERPAIGPGPSGY